MAMEANLARFLNAVRSRSRAVNRPVYEEMVLQLERSRRRRRAVRSGDLTAFVADWMLHEGRLESARRCRRFVAAVQVLSRWLAGANAPSRQGDPRLACLARDAVRAAAANQLFATVATGDRPERVGRRRVREGHWHVALRGDHHLVLRDVRGGPLLGPVTLAAPVVRALPRGAILGLRLRGAAGGWRVEALGTCYPAGVAPALGTGRR